MAFVTKTWKDRLVEFAGRRKLKNVSTGEEILMDVSRSEGTVMQPGDAFSAENMNNLEQRIKTEFDNVNSSLDEQPDFIYDATGKITGYKTKAGADTVFPFKKGIVTFHLYKGIRSGSSLEAFGVDLTDFKKITFYGNTILDIYNSGMAKVTSRSVTSSKQYIDITSWSGVYYFSISNDDNQYRSCAVELE